MAEWKHGLCGCFDNCGICLLSYFVPCYQFGKNAEAVGESCLLCGISFLTPAIIITGPIVRGKIREKQGIPGSFVTDLLKWWCCSLCALVQEAQEVREFAPSAMALERE